MNRGQLRNPTLGNQVWATFLKTECDRKFRPTLRRYSVCNFGSKKIPETSHEPQFLLEYENYELALILLKEFEEKNANKQMP